MDADTLHAVDALYLRAFHQNLLADIRQARISLSQRRGQAASLAVANELPLALRQNYGRVAERLPPLLSALSNVLDDLEAGALSWQAAVQPVDESVATAAPDDACKIIKKLDVVEQEILAGLNDVGVCLAGLPSSVISWEDCARLKIHVILERLAERPCYSLDRRVDLSIHPFLIAAYGSRQHEETQRRARSPHYLVDEMVPLKLLPLINALWIEVEARGEGKAILHRRDGAQQAG